MLHTNTGMSGKFCSHSCLITVITYYYYNRIYIAHKFKRARVRGAGV